MAPLHISYTQLSGSTAPSRRKRVTKWLGRRSRRQVILCLIVLVLVAGAATLLGLLLSHATTSPPPAPQVAPLPSPMPPPIVSDKTLSMLLASRDPFYPEDYEHIMVMQAASSLHGFMAQQVKQYNRKQVDDAAGVGQPFLISQLAISSRLAHERANITIYSPASWYWVRPWWHLWWHPWWHACSIHVSMTFYRSWT